MKKFFPYLIIIVLLGGALGWLIWTKSSGTDEVKEHAFAIEKQSDITRITMEDAAGKKIDLRKVNGVWMVNGKFAARAEMMQTLMEAITRVTILAPAPKAAHDNVIREMLERHVKVEVYTDGEKPARSYYVGDPTPDTEGTYMLLERDGKPLPRPYITYMPGLKGYMTLRFNTDEENWKSKELFNYADGSIKSVVVEYPEEEKKSFSITQIAADSFVLAPMDAKYKIEQPYQQKYIRQYLSFYSSISFEAYDNTFSKKDSMMHTTPYCIMSVTDTHNVVTKARIFYLPVTERSRTPFDSKGNELTHDTEHFHAAIHDDKDYVILQYYVFGKLWRKYEDFFFKPSTNPQ